MAEDEPAKAPLSAVVPVLVAVLICDATAVEPLSGKKSLIGIFDKLFASSLPVVRPMAVYIKFTDAEGRYQFALRLVHLDSSTVLAETRGEIEVASRLDANDGIFPSGSPFPFPFSGRYELQVLANEVFLGSATIDVALMSQGGA